MNRNLSRLRTLFYFLLPLSIFLASCKSAKPFTDYKSQKSVIADKAVVSAAHPLATKVGLNIIKQGGNAVDAAVAVQLALAVVYPRAGNLGGGGFLVYRSGDGSEVNTLDFREKAPGAASRDMYLDNNKNVIESKSQKGHYASGVPGTVDGCYKMFQKYSKLKDWKKLVQPAIDLAKNGFAITESEANRLNVNRLEFIKSSTMPSALILKDSAMKWKTGDILRQPELAKTLERIRDNGREGFYAGKTADLIVAEMKRGNGLITKGDLANYAATWRKPLIGKYRGYDIITMPPPSSGGIALLQLLGTVEDYPLSNYGFHSPEAIHLFIEAERRAYADRAEHLGDADFYPVPVNGLTAKSYIVNRFKDFMPNRASKSDDIKAGEPHKESEQTTHLSIVDADGNAASVTTTLNDNYGCRTIVGGAGFLLNNEMDDFSVKPGVPNMYGAIGGEANAILANKRPLSSMTPTIVTKDGKLFMVVGTPGGTTIITSVFQVITNVIDFNMSATEATHAKRFHSQWKPDVVMVEKDAFSDLTVKKLKGMGHNITARPYIGLVETILVRPDGKLEGAADNRSDDSAEGF
ncbi:MAG: gamma-glutamyltransferase [Saprospiraceae bacterium]|nr:gamma-glutamyltransferase [Saprospiraceae bacterium]